MQRRAESLRLVGGRAVLFDERMNALDEEVGDRVRRVPDVDRRHLAFCFPGERGDQSRRWVRDETESFHPLVELCTRSRQSLNEHDLQGNPRVTAPGRPDEILIGDSLVMVTADAERDLFAAFLYVYVGDADEVYLRALTAGAESLEPPVDTPYGDRRAMVRDPFGNIFQIAHQLR